MNHFVFRSKALLRKKFEQQLGQEVRQAADTCRLAIALVSDYGSGIVGMRVSRGCSEIGLGLRSRRTTAL